MQELERCVRCTLPITWETLYFDNEGVCNICRNWEKKHKTINWEERERKLLDIFEEAKKAARERDVSYDCIVPFSGGKDSTFILWTVVRKYKLKPLVVSFDHCFYRPKTMENRQMTLRKLRVDALTFTPNWDIVKKTMLEFLKRKGDFCWHCHMGIAAYPMQIAVKFRIPLVIWGEGGGEYEGYFKYEDLEETDEWKFNRRSAMGIRAEDMKGFIGVELRDLAPYVYPSKEEIEKAGVRSLPLGNFIPWNVQKHVEIITKELSWQRDETESVPLGLTYEKIECMFTGVRDYIKYIKRGFSRLTHLMTLDIRHEKISRDEAMKVIRKYEGCKPRSLKVFLEYSGISEEEFNEICLNHIIPPAKHIDVEALPVGQKLWDQDLWFKES